MIKEYRERGWSLIPIKEGSKIPSIRWKEYIDGKRYDGDLNGRIGLITGPASGVFVVDIDNKDGRAKDRKDSILRQWPTGLLSKTPSGGFHLFYATDHRLPNTQGRLGDNIDTRGYGGYVLVPPSEGYTWVTQDSPSPVPQELSDKLLVKDRDVKTTGDDAIDLLNRVVSQGFTEGQHNEQLRDLTRLFARSQDNPGLQRSIAENLLRQLDAADPTPQGEEHFFPTFNSAWQYETKRLRKKDIKPGGEDLMTMHHWAELLEPFEENYLIEQWLPEAAITVMAGPPQSYKTWLELDMAVSLALGDVAEPFLGQFEVNDKRRHPVLIIQQDDYILRVIDRLKTIIAWKTRNVNWSCRRLENGAWLFDGPHLAPIYLHTDRQLQLDKNPDSVPALERRIAEIKPSLVIIDALYSLYDSSNFFQELAREIKINFGRMRDRYGTSFVLVHHTKKVTSGGEGRERMFGSNLFNATVEGAIMVDQVSSRTIKTHYGGKSGAIESSFEITFNIDTDDDTYQTDVVESQSDYNSVHDGRIVELLENEGEMTVTEISNALRSNKGTIHRRLTSLVNDGTVIKNSKRYAIKMDNLEAF